MLQVKVVLVLLIIILTNVESATVRLFFSRCGVGGFSCVTDANNYHITFTCPTGTDDVTLYLWNFRGPTTTVGVKVQQCQTVRFSFACHNENRPVRYVSIVNVTNLEIIPSVLTHNPPVVTFENITNLDYLPTHTFSQIKRETYKPGCSNPTNDFESVIFKNVGIGTIATKAFDNLRNFINFTWYQVDVKRIQYAAIQIELNMTNSDFHIEQSTIGSCEHLAFQITGRGAIFVDNKFYELSTSSINGTIESFKFITNKIVTLSSSAISILAQDVSISNNDFEYLHAGALQNISPGLLQDSQRNFGTLRFFYEFSLNNLKFIEAGSLNPDIVAYNNVATNLKFTRNRFLCTCENFGWLFVDVGHGFKTKSLQQFYTRIVDKQYKNICGSTSCELPVNQVQQLLNNGTCLSNVTVESLCVEKTMATRILPIRTVAISRATEATPNRRFGRVFTRANSASKLTHFNIFIFFCIFGIVLF